jgi:Holliday junction DNA helicase RuvA
MLSWIPRLHCTSKHAGLEVLYPTDYPRKLHACSSLVAAVQCLLRGRPLELIDAVKREDKTKLEKIPKVKGKTSEKILFEVKQNLKKFEGFLEDSSSSSPKSANESLSILALLQLGFDEKTANREVKKQLEKTPDAETADIIREVLKYS